MAVDDITSSLERSSTGNTVCRAEIGTCDRNTTLYAEYITGDDTHEMLKEAHMNPSVDASASTTSNCDGIDEYFDGGTRPPSAGRCRNVMPDVPVENLYEGSNGRYYTDCQLRWRLRTDRWTPCIRQRDPDRRLVETSDGSLLLLLPTDDLPVWAELRIDDRGARVVDTRRPVPNGSLPE